MMPEMSTYILLRTEFLSDAFMSYGSVKSVVHR